MSTTRGWPVGRAGSRGFLDMILLRQLRLPLCFGACPLGFGDAVPDSTFAWSCFILLDLAPCSGLGRPGLDPGSLPRPRPLCLPAPGLPQFPSGRQPPSRAAAWASPGGMAASGDPSTLGRTSSQYGNVAEWLRGQPWTCHKPLSRASVSLSVKVE